MLYLILLLILTVVSFLLLREILARSLSRKEEDCRRLELECRSTKDENDKLKLGNSGLDNFSVEIIALYDITRDICATLNEEKTFSIFRHQIDRYIKIGDCKFLKSDVDISGYRDYTVLPLALRKSEAPIGYLVASDIRKEDKDKFHILAQQFMIGIKRALLYEKVQELTITDGLTQVFSRRYFMDRFAEELERSKKLGFNCSFLMIDVDHFKQFNDNYGHLVGDAVLRDVSQTIKESIRQIDFMGRYGGEELAVILAETDRDQACLAAERIRQAIELRSIRVYDEDLKTTISIGVSTFPKDTSALKGLIDKADQALYRAKNSGRNRICC